MQISRRFHLPPLALLGLIPFLAACGGEGAGKAKDRPPVRHFQFHYSVTIPGRLFEASQVRVFIPLPLEDGNQSILKKEISSPVPGEFKVEKKYGNHFWYAQFPKGYGKDCRIRGDFYVERKGERPGFDHLASKPDLFLKPNALVPVEGRLIQKEIQNLPPSGAAVAGVIPRARQIFDYVVGTMEYKKVGDGWGKGSTAWACSSRYGNCTDFHALFLSLARAEKIPSRFVIGFPIPEGKKEGKIGGYHCWVEFLDKKKGWIPLDASEAWKHPKEKERLFGSLPPDRIAFTMGRDLVLSEDQKSGPLNYFVYPLIETGKKRLSKKDGVQISFSFQEG